MDGQPKISDQAMDLYLKMQSASVEQGTVDFSQQDLSTITGISSMPELIGLAQQLVNEQMIQILTGGSNEIVFRLVASGEATKRKKLSADELMVYDRIAESERQGIWIRIIKERTQLHQTVVQRCLKSLESQKLIKPIKDVKKPTRKLYILYNLSPSQNITGGPWYSNGDLDVEFVNSLLKAVWQYAVHRTFPSAFEEDDEEDDAGIKHKPQLTYPAHHSGYPTVAEIQKFVVDSEIVKDTELGEADIRQLCELLVYDDKLERRDGGFSYRATWQSVIQSMSEEELDPFSESACGKCPSFVLCKDDGPVNPVECRYYDEWLTV